MQSRTQLAVRRAEKLRCPACGAVLMSTPSGAVCPESMDHGRLRTGISSRRLDTARAFDRWVRQLPKAERVQSGWSIQGRSGYRRWYPVISRQPTFKLFGSGSYATVDGKPYRFIPPEESP